MKIEKLLELLPKCCLMVLCISFAFKASADTYITQNDGHHIRVSEPISTVFISAPDIADYNVVDEHTVVVFAKELGQSKIIIYGEGNKILLTERIVVDIDLSHVRRQLRAFYPNLDIKIESIGEQVVVSGIVNSEEERDDIYRLIATLLGREKLARYENTQQLTYETETLSIPESEALIFSRNMSWEGIVEQLQVAAVQQVNVKISVAQVTETFGQTIGVDWSSVGANVGEFLFQQFDAADLTTVITALGNENIAQILAEPNLTVVSGESASFLVGGEIPVIVATGDAINITFREYGVRLGLTAKVHSDERIRMQLMPEVSEVERYIQAAGIEVPQLATRRAMTTVELGDGDSFVLGGLMSSSDLEELQKTPLLGDIPLLGAAFRKSNTDRRRTELIIVATVNLVKPLKSKDVQIPQIQRTSTFYRWLNIGDPTPAIKGNEPAIELLSEGGFIR